MQSQRRVREEEERESLGTKEVERYECLSYGISLDQAKDRVLMCRG
jgi:hypothetical protein